ncbi:hypothetical protein PoB_007176900 [Plakobranchus ocellatus]|uniref:Uncharacterized protein n=1 Tax=Plakobranchus ocellatus TaxID=259542 RepID=A0AAV4DM65_9GAST|nr:hypothetical protein PoB_007176900 [Plakobranchus ocellatus]
MFLSDDITHDYHAVHQFTLNSIQLLQKETPVEEVIVWSDSAAAQYQGKESFADASLYPCHFQRNYFGSEHGKGEADGGTGRFVQSLKNAEDMAAFGIAHFPSSNSLKT